MSCSKENECVRPVRPETRENKEKLMFFVHNLFCRQWKEFVKKKCKEKELVRELCWCVFFSLLLRPTDETHGAINTNIIELITEEYN